MAINENGLQFYQIHPDYPGDKLKGCGLQGEEIDGNFNFLRGMDISDIEFDKDKEEIALRKFNGDKILFPKEIKDLAKYGFLYDKDNGILTVAYPDGEDLELPGFTKVTDMAISTTERIIGDGTLEHPLDVSTPYLTGTYKPAKQLIDLSSETPGTLPENPSEGERYVTKEKINLGGLFYTYDEIVNIQEDLAKHSSEWRVPTIDEWNEMLNAQECEADRNHDDKDSCYKPLGRLAGKMVKSGKDESFGGDLWNEWEGEKETEGTRNETCMTILPMGSKTEFGASIQGLGEVADLWSISSETPDDKRDIMGKRFVWDSNQVTTISLNPARRVPLRLVKKYNGSNFKEYENIEGVPVPTVLVENCSLVWTRTNVSLPQYITEEGITEKLYECINKNEKFKNIQSEIKYFANEWFNGRWNKIEIKEGESIVIFESPEDPESRMHEWRVIDGVLVDTAVAIKNEFAEELDALSEKINKEIKDREQADENISETLVNETEERQAKDEELENKIDSEIEKRESEDNSIKSDLKKEAETRESVDNSIKSALETEAEERRAKDGELENEIDSEIVDRKSEDASIKSLLETETKERKAKDEELENSISGSTTEINDKITALGNELKEADENLQSQIDLNKVRAFEEDYTIVTEIIDEKEQKGTAIKVNIPADKKDELPGHIFSDKDGLYFDGCFGEF